jgi:hypothetical protein
MAASRKKAQLSPRVICVINDREKRSIVFLITRLPLRRAHSIIQASA